MNLEDALRSAGAVLVRRPSKVLPAFVAESGSGIVVQTVWLAAAILSYVSLRGTGKLEAVLRAYRDLLAAIQSTSGSPTPGPMPGGGFFGPEVVDAQEAFGRAMIEVFTPTVIAIVAVAALLVLVVGLVVRAVVGAAKVNTARAAMESGWPLVAAVEGAREDAVSFLAYGLLQLVVFGGIALLGLLSVGLLVSGSILLALLAVVLLGVVGLLAVVAYVALLFVPEAIVADEVGVAGGIRRNLGFCRSQPGRAVGYVAIDLGIRVVALVIGVVLQLLGIGQLVPLAWLLALGPFLGLLKMGLYVDVERPTVDSEPLFPVSSLVEGFRQGFRELGWFLTRRAYLVVVAAAVFVAGGYAGWSAGTALGVRLPGSESGNDALFGAFGTVPFDDFVQIAANNWLVALSHSFAGMAFGVPTVANLLFNGLIVGGLAAVSPTDPQVFAALIVPHGIVEVPALSVSGGLGLYLGWKTFQYLTGSLDAEALAGEIHRAFYVLIGLLPVFVIASFLETFVTPFVGKAVRAAIGG